MMSISLTSNGCTFLHTLKGHHSRSTLFQGQLQVNSFPNSLPFSFNLLNSSKKCKNNIYPVHALSTSAVETPKKQEFRSKKPSDVNVLVVGSTGYIGKFVVKELVKRGFNVIAVARERVGRTDDILVYSFLLKSLGPEFLI